MLKNLLKTAWRSLTRNPAFSLINILGLALGLACSLLIILWVRDERNMNAFHANRADLYDVYERVFAGNKVEGAWWTPGVLAAELKRRLPEIKYSSAFDPDQSATFQVGDKIIDMEGAAADSDFFKMFSYPILEGTAADALNTPDKIAISRKMAVNFFGSPAAAINQTIRYDNARVFRIAAIFEDPGTNSSDRFDYIVNWPFHLDTVGWLKEWIYRSPHTYIQLQPGVNPATVGARVLHFMDSYLTTSREGAGFHIELGLQKFDEMYLRSVFRNGYPAGGRIEYVRLFTIVAIFILLIACINFMNLSTARSVKRAKEVGIRKTIGAARIELIGQFIGEALFMVIGAAAIALCLVACILPLFNTMTGKQIVLPLTHPAFWYIVAVLVLLTGFTAGSYPALFMSSLRPVKVLKGTLKFSPSAFWLRKGLVIFQFTLSILLIIGMMVISRQVNYLQTVNLGFDRDNLIYTPVQGTLWRNYQAFKDKLTGMPGIQAVTRTDQPPQQTGAHAYDMTWEGKDPAARTVVIHTTVGYGWLKMLNLKLLQGRDFSPDYPTDTNAYIINETALKLIGYKNPIGRPLSIFDQHYKIIGVVKDFHFKSLHDPIEPLLINLNEHIDWGFVMVKARPGQTKEAVASMEKVHHEFEPDFPFQYHFSDEEYQHLYNNEQMIGRLSDSFAILAVFISCLGLLGLAMFTSEQRTKEIGIRKVLGASELNIFGMLSKDFLQLVGIALVIASPLAWLLMDNWLREYAYRTNIAWWIFVVAGLAALLIALLTISFQAFKAALANPADSLRPVA
ncbi:MAG TPA: ABC transporter permease [Puia sp.]|nr:ABC transporter permease [Puia sp.]